MDVSIRINRLHTFDCLLADRPSLTHLRLCWPPLELFNDYLPSDTIIHSVTHLHIPRHPRDSLNKILTLFPNVTHLRLSTESFLKDIVLNTRNLEVLTLDAPPNYKVAGQYFSSLRFWNITSALNKGLFGTREEMSQRKIVINTGPETPDGWQHVADACTKHLVHLEQSQIYPRALPQPYLSQDHWAYGKWV
jgi:hypothetical protein